MHFERRFVAGPGCTPGTFFRAHNFSVYVASVSVLSQQMRLAIQSGLDRIRGLICLEQEDNP